MSRMRSARLGEQLRRELSLKLAGQVRDPGLGPVTVTDVRVTDGLWLARVHVQLYGTTEEQAGTLAALRRAAPFLRSVLGKELHIRRMPELRFHRDDSLESGKRIDSILREVLPPEGSAGTEDDGEPRSGDDPADP